MKKSVVIYDTTLRDGTQGEGISFSAKDKLSITKRLDESGIHYIEGGNPASNPKDADYYSSIRKLHLSRAKITAFGSTRRANLSAKDDPTMTALLEAGTPAVAIFGKSWVLHVKKVLRVSLEENLKMIESSIRYIKSKGKEVVYDAEHFFDGYKDNPGYAVSSLIAAERGGADWLVLCDTNGGTLPDEIEEITRAVSGKTNTALGIHAHNDAGLAVANSIAAVRAGASQVQGTFNGYGERCGNADLCSVIPILKEKMGIDCMRKRQLRKLVEISRFVSELANVIPSSNQPFVGVSAFAHKGGMHVDAVRKTTLSFEHIKPELVGNERRLLVSELSGRAGILSKGKTLLNLTLKKDSKKAKSVIGLVKKLEYEGYEFEAAEASLKLLMKRAISGHRGFFEPKGFRVSVEKKNGELISEATVKLEVGGVEAYTVAEGDGPVNALDTALRKALLRFYPTLGEMHLADFRVRVLDASSGTAAKVRVFVEFRDLKDSWRTVGVSENIIEASWQALVDSIEYKILKDKS